MSIQFSIFLEDNLLKVKASGKDDNLEDVLNYTNAIIDAALQNNAHRILCDERDLEYNLSIGETFQLAEIVAEKHKYAERIAIVHHPQFETDAQFYETVATNRGLIVKVTSNIEFALKWLKEDT